MKKLTFESTAIHETELTVIPAQAGIHAFMKSKDKLIISKDVLTIFLIAS